MLLVVRHARRRPAVAAQPVQPPLAAGAQLQRLPLGRCCCHRLCSCRLFCVAAGGTACRAGQQRSLGARLSTSSLLSALPRLIGVRTAVDRSWRAVLTYSSHPQVPVLSRGVGAVDELALPVQHTQYLLPVRYSRVQLSHYYTKRCPLQCSVLCSVFCSAARLSSLLRCLAILFTVRIRALDVIALVVRLPHCSVIRGALCLRAARPSARPRCAAATRTTSTP